jgi:predicted transcriptional regulator of viral defense system
MAVVPINEYLSQEIFSFTWEEAVAQYKGPEEALRVGISRSVQKGEIFNLRQGFYLIFPPRYKPQQYLPLPLYIDKLFEFINRDYYMALYSAASLYGASHQQVMRDYILIPPPPLLNIDKGNFDLRFFTQTHWPPKNILKKKSDAGYFKLSSPALTAADLVHYHKKIGGINRVLTVLTELVEEITHEDLTDLLSWYPYKSSLQRFGYLLEQTGAKPELIQLLRGYFKTKKYYPTLLSPRSKQRPGAVDNYWKVDVNVHVDSDL